MIMKLDKHDQIENVVSQEKEQKEVKFIEGDHLRNIFGDREDEELEGFFNKISKKINSRSVNPTIDALEEVQNLTFAPIKIKPKETKIVYVEKELSFIDYIIKLFKKLWH